MEVPLPIARTGLLLTAAAALAVTGCASVPPDRGMANVRALTAARGAVVPETAHDAPDAPLAVAGRTLGAAEAVEIALTRNPRLRKGYAELGFAAAEVYEAGRLSNPRLSLSVLDPSGAGAASQVTVGIAQNFTELLMLPARGRIAAGEFERARALVGANILRLAAETEAAWYGLVAARQSLALREAILKAAEASATLSDRYHDAGNIPELALRLEQAAAARARIDLLAARDAEAAARETLAGLMGVTAADGDWSVPDRLALPSGTDAGLETLKALAEANRLDLAAARKEVELARAGADLTRRFRWLGEIELGVERERDTDRSHLTGPTVSWAVPLFNRNEGGVLRARSRAEAAEAELRALRVAADNQIERGWRTLANARERIAAYRDGLLPAREQAVARMQERVNAMLDGPFELLRLKQQEYEGWQGYVEAIRDYWQARAELARLVGARLPDGPPETTPGAAPAPSPAIPEAASPDAPSASPHDHHQH
jgi:cobalt-zinc-cadmium efflux system outer membrane protein